MPSTTSTNRVPVTFRLAPKGRVWIDDTRRKYDTDMSTVVRAALAVARAHPDELRQRIEEAG